MTRPQIIRADTIDLQDKTSPTAQDHSLQPQHPAPLGIGPAAPHQEATLRRVDEERTNEEVHLQNGGWSDANTLRDDPGSDDERTVVTNGNGDREFKQDEQAVRLNGGMTGNGDDGELADADVEEDMDDDMMDKISSSPSIDDGGYSLPSPTHWPERRTSLTPGSAPISPDSGMDSSSPFITTPIHFPHSAAAARRPNKVPARHADSISKSPYRSSPIPSKFPSPQKDNKRPADHHHMGEYKQERGTNRSITSAKSLIGVPNDSPRTQRLRKVEFRIQNLREDSQMSLLSDLNDEDMRSLLKPVPSPGSEEFDLADIQPTGEQATLGRTSFMFEDLDDDDDYDDDDSWTTDSDADSWDEEAGDDDDDDESNGISFSENPRFIDSGWGGECLREAEDIDFEFVYALHTFVATVEGQANATKGDTMVLLDDSNSYWWLVRVVKDSSIGYLPAEHIETPTERLARLNKHRNIDLSATMLGDTAEKTKNPLKKAMRRRNAKTVQFAPPTYVDAVDYDYSSDENGDEELFGGVDPNQAQNQTTTVATEPEQDENLKVQPLKVNGAKKDANSNASEQDGSRNANDEAVGDGGKPRTSDEMFDRPMDPKVSRNGTMRNTDSFFKDDNAETRKITLTPNLLRDDSSTSTTGSRERGPSLESLEKNGFADKVKDDKKKKEKKPGMLSGLFKRKEKKPKGLGPLDSFDSDIEKQSEELGRNSPQSKGSDDGSLERPSAEQTGSPSPSRQASKGKLQKPQRSRDGSPIKTVKAASETDKPEPSTTVQNAAPQDAPATKPAGPQGPSTMRMVSPEREEEKPSIEGRVQSPETRSRSNSTLSKVNPINMLKSQPNAEPRPEKVKKAKQRVQLDDFDSEEDEKNDPFADPQASKTSHVEEPEPEPTGRLSESPVQISAADAQPPGKENIQEKQLETDPQQPPDLTGDTSSQETSSPISTPSPDDSPSTTAPTKPNLAVSRPVASPSPTQLAPPSSIPPPSRPAPVPTKDMEDLSPPVSSESTSLPAWSDSSLRAYLDDGTDIRDMLLVVNDTTGVVPVGPEHPIMSRLFVEETKAVSQLGGELDSLLNKWIETKRKKQKTAKIAR
ncbi:hypothetical protein EJ04DRAFT_252512 [Polyplosphaeria fusca]|uniref:SH3 domain-containing protein n=1 Tax=Polyplosphaeria fusca TaxID=682080 RepID=A0A9P4QZ28_9PLEO|nr:hypothetical protein EJ04DRAFT_252512 [Polyplosphaeria fusca]